MIPEFQEPISGKQKIFPILQDMKKMLTKAGGNEERTVFLFSDTQIKDCGGMTFTCRSRWGFIQRWSLKMASCSCQSNLFVVGFSGIAVAPRFAVFRNHRFSHDPTWFSCWCLVSLFVGLNRRLMSEELLQNLQGFHSSFQNNHLKLIERVGNVLTTGVTVRKFPPNLSKAWPALLARTRMKVLWKMSTICWTLERFQTSFLRRIISDGFGTGFWMSRDRSKGKVMSHGSKSYK